MKFTVFLRAVMTAAFFLSASQAHADIIFSDTHFVQTFRDASRNLKPYQFNRLRADADVENAEGNLRAKGIFDIEHLIGNDFLNSSLYQLTKDPDPSLPFNPHFKIYRANDVVADGHIYRLYSEMRSERQSFVFGLQRIPLGVGRLWNPTDTFHPVDITNIEPEEREGIFAARLTHYISDLSWIEFVGSFAEQMSLNRSGIHYKGNHWGMDMGFSYVQNSDFRMIGLEWESNVGDTGGELRSEVGFFDHADLDRSYVSGMIGGEYGFPNNVTVIAEYFYNGLGAADEGKYNPATLVNGNWNLARHYLGAQINYEVTPLTLVSFSSIYNLIDQSFFLGPSVQRSLDNETTLRVGATLYEGRGESEFGGSFDNVYYLQWQKFF